MTPRSAAAAVSPAPGRQARPTPRPSLRQVAAPRAERGPVAALRVVRRRVRPVGLAAAIVVASLLAVVIGNMELASGQLRLEQVQSQLSAVQSSYSQALAEVTIQSSPQNVDVDAGKLHLVPPTEVLPIRSVSLEQRLPPPTFSSMPCCSLTPGR